jgi:hypothetical protein
MRSVHEVLACCLVDSNQCDSERRGQDKVTLIVAIQADLGYNLDLIIREVVSGFPTYPQYAFSKQAAYPSANNCSGFVAPPFPPATLASLI